MKNKEILSKITLGTAQLGFPYGIANQIGEISSIHATEILRHSINMKINSFDTAPNYGKSEEVIGNFIQNSKNRVSWNSYFFEHSSKMRKGFEEAHSHGEIRRIVGNYQNLKRIKK